MIKRNTPGYRTIEKRLLIPDGGWVIYCSGRVVEI
ncbi:hypothetical protein B0G75_1123 [Paraburkholderia sp. BL18I3N2]|nr:hypothetical protein B0G75_1123 [Paraburkholderia sp. BL18I3N2]